MMCMFSILKLAAAAIMTALLVSGLATFDKIQGRLCISSQFTELDISQETQISCAASCLLKPRCQAFTMQSGGSQCAHFVFDKCSKNVLSSCNCLTKGPVFIRRQSGLQAGQLCPQNYANELCGVKYMRFSISDGKWTTGRDKCQVEPGLTIMADIMDVAERTHALTQFGSSSFYLSGKQLPGSVEPGGGWMWSSCNISIDSTLWSSGEPNNGGGGPHEQVTGIYSGYLLTDLQEIATTGVLCECVSPF